MASIRENLITLTSNINRIKSEVSDVMAAFDNAGLKTTNNKLLLSDVITNINNKKVTILVDKSVSKFVYTVSGFSSTYADANGNYYKYSSQINGRDCYTNGKCYMYYQPNYWMGWTINSNLDNISNPSYYAYISGESIIGNWTSNNSDQITVSEYTGELEEDQTDKIPKVTISVSGEGVSSTSSIGTLNVTAGYNPSFGYTSNLTINCFPESTYNLIPGDYSFSLNNPTGFNTSLSSGSSYGTINGGAELNLQILCSPRTDCSLTISCVGSPSSPDGYATSLSAAKWSIDGGVTWTDSGYTRYDLTYNQLYTVIFSEVQGYTTPSPIQIRLSDYGMTSDYRSVTYQSSMGVLLVSGSNYPTGAQWSIDSGVTWKEFNTTVTVNAGSYTVQFKDISGYTTPVSQTVNVIAGQQTSITVGEYIASGGDTPSGDVDTSKLVVEGFTGSYAKLNATYNLVNGTFWKNDALSDGYVGILEYGSIPGSSSVNGWKFVSGEWSDLGPFYITSNGDPLSLIGTKTFTDYSGNNPVAQVTFSHPPKSDAGSGITVTGLPSQYSQYNTTYQLSQDGTYWYSDETPDDYVQERIFWGEHPGNGRMCWILGDDTGTMEAFIYTESSDPQSIIGNNVEVWGGDGGLYSATITSGGSGGGDSDKTYVYTVNGFTGGSEGANGDYWETDQTTTNSSGTVYKVYTNGSYYMYYNPSYWIGWTINTTVNTAEAAYAGYVSAEDPTYNNWQPSGVTVTAYTGSSGSGGGSGNKPTGNFVYTVSGCGVNDVNGDYYDTGEVYNGESIYTNEKAYLQYCGPNGMWGNWSIHNTKSDQTYDTCYCYANSGITGTYSSGMLSSTGCTVAEYVGGSGDSGGDVGGESGNAKITISGADQTGANQTYSLTSGDPDNLASGTPVIFTGDSNTSSMAWTIKFQYIPEAYMTEVNIYCDLMIGMGPELQYMTMSATEPTIDNILNNSPVWTDSTGSSRKDLSVTYSSGGSLPGGLHEFVYKVAGAGFTEANGNYWDSGEMYDGTYPIYTNGKYKMYQYDMLGYCIDNENGFTIYTSMDGFTGNWTTNGNGGEPAPTVTEYSGASSSIVVSNAVSDINWINTTYNMTSDTDNQKEFVSSDGTQLIIAVTTRQQDNGINGTSETGWEVRFVKSGYNTLISKYLYSNWQNVFTSDFELIHDGVSGGTIYSGIILQYSDGGSSSGGTINTDIIIISGAGSSQVNGTYTKTEESGTAGQTDYRRVYKTADGNGIISIGVVDGSISPAINATLTYTGIPYYQSATVNTVAEIASATWNTIAAGQTPVPTVTFGS